MNYDAPYIILSLLFSITLIIILFIVFVVIIRWVLRINTIVDCLQRLADRLAPQLSHKELKHKSPKSPCDCCHKDFDPIQLVESDIGKMVCPSCLKFLKSG